MNEKAVPQAAINIEERRENGRSLIVIGFLLWFFDALIFFYLPAGFRLGEQRGFVLLTVSAFIAGAIAMSLGFFLRSEKR